MKRIIFSLITVLSTLLLNAQILDPVIWSWEIKSENVEVGDEVELVFNLSMEENWYVYANDFDPSCGPNLAVFSFEPNSSYERIGEVVAVDVKEKYDEIFECDVKVFQEYGKFTQKIKVLSKDLLVKGSYEYQTCNEVTGLCLPPKEAEFTFSGYEIKGTERKTAEKPVLDSESSKKIINEDEIKSGEESSEEEENPFGENSILDQATDESLQETVYDLPIEEFQTGEDKTLWAFMVIAFLSGLAALITPCVFPMIPMTVTFFLKDKKDEGPNGWKPGVIFGISIIVIYTILGTIFSLIFGADSLNAMATHWLPNIFAFSVFFIFSLSFLGMFEISLPSALVNKIDAKSDQGGLIGIFFMAFTLALVSFSCTFPIIGLVLALSAQGAFIKPILGMVSFSLAMALPFTLFAIFPHWLQKLPRSGGWLNSVKVVLGFLELALGLKFLSIADLAYHWGILDREIYIAAWIVIFTLMGFYLLGKIRMPHDSPLEKVSVPRVVLSIVVFTFVMYLIPGMFGAPLKGLSGYLPPMYTMDTFANPIAGGDSASTFKYSDECAPPMYSDILHFPHGIQGYFDLDQALECAKSVNKPVLIDFTGHGCVNCRKMEEYVWADPEVLNVLKNDFVIAALYVDDKTVLPEEDWYTSEVDGRVKKTIGKQNADYQINRFNNNAQPFYIILSPEGRFLHGPGQYDPDVQTFMKFLQTGKQKYNSISSR